MTLTMVAGNFPRLGAHIRGLLALFVEDIEWFTPGEGLPLAGTYRGCAARADFFQKASEMVEFSSFEPREFVAEGDRVLVVGLDSGRVKATNRAFEGHWVMAFTVQNGKVTNVREPLDTLAVARAFAMAASECVKGTPKFTTFAKVLVAGSGICVFHTCLAL